MSYTSALYNQACGNIGRVLHESFGDISDCENVRQAVIVSCRSADIRSLRYIYDNYPKKAFILRIITKYGEMVIDDPEFMKYLLDNMDLFLSDIERIIQRMCNTSCAYD